MENLYDSKKINVMREMADAKRKEVEETKKIAFISNGRKSDIKIQKLYGVEIYVNYDKQCFDLYLEYRNIYGEYKNIRNLSVEKFL